MLALLCNVLLSVSFGHVMKWSTQRRAHLLWVGAVNYIGGSTVCLLLSFTHPSHSAVGFTVVTGLWAGVSYLISLLYYFAAVTRLGMGLATSAIRVSVALPVAVAIVVWREPLGLAQSVGLALVALALVLLGSGDLGASRQGVLQLFGLILPLFLVTGLGQLAARIFSSGAPQQNVYLYTGALFGGAALAAMVALTINRQPLSRQDVCLGLLLGSVNIGSNLCLLQALRELPSAEVFAVSSAASVALAALTGVWFWHERLARPAMVAVAATSVAVVLLTR